MESAWVSGCLRASSIPRVDRRINAPAIAIGICSLLVPILMALGSCWAMRGMAPEVSRGALALMNDETGAQGALGLPAARGALLAFDAAGASAELAVHRADTQSDRIETLYPRSYAARPVESMHNDVIIPASNR
jgi:hypothetical protein